VRRLSVAGVIACVLMLGVPLVAQSQEPQSNAQDQQKAELVNIKGTVRADGDRIKFVADDTGKSWDVTNPETLKSHVGHHVELSAHVYLDKSQIQVMKVTML